MIISSSTYPALFHALSIVPVTMGLLARETYWSDLDLPVISQANDEIGSWPFYVVLRLAGALNCTEEEWSEIEMTMAHRVFHEINGLH